MPLPNSGTITFSDFQTEFSGSGISTPISFSQMYRNTGPYVEDIIIQTGTETSFSYGLWSAYQYAGPLSLGSPNKTYWSMAYRAPLYDPSPFDPESILIWEGTTISFGSAILSFNFNGYQYQAGPEQFRDNQANGEFVVYRSLRRRTYDEIITPVFENLNGDVPTSGTIRMSNMYGARDAD